MKKLNGLVAFAIAVSLSGAALAATLSNGNGQTCSGTGTWHFVNNQTGGAPAGVLNGSWNSGDTCTASASKVNASTQHFYCVASGTLLTASTNLPGRLVLSDFSCETTKCVPTSKTEICGDGLDNDCNGKVDDGCK